MGKDTAGGSGGAGGGGKKKGIKKFFSKIIKVRNVLIM